MAERYPVTVAVRGLDAALRPGQRAREGGGRDPGMRILVCVKRVPLTGGKMVLTADEQAIETRHLGFTISPHEECGVEEAVRLVEAARRRGRPCSRSGPPRPRSRSATRWRSAPTAACTSSTDGEEWDPQATAAAIVDGDRGRGGRGRRLRPDRVRQRVGRLGQLPGRHPRGARARAAGRDRAEGPVGGRRPRALRAGGARRPRRLRRAAAGRRERARGHQPAALPVGAGEAARALEAGRAAQPGASGRAAREAAPGRAAGAGQAGGGARPGRRTRRPRWSRSCASWGWPDGRPRSRRAGATSSRCRRWPSRATLGEPLHARRASTPRRAGLARRRDRARRGARPARRSTRPGRGRPRSTQLIERIRPRPWSPRARTAATRCSRTSPARRRSPVRGQLHRGRRATAT